MDSDEIISQLLNRTLEQNNKLTEALAKATQAIETLSGRVETLEKALHTPPCRGLENLCREVSNLTTWREKREKESGETKARFSSLFWSLVTNAAVGGLGVIGTLLALGWKSWINQ